MEMNGLDEARAVLSHITVLRHHCDLDLLMFFSRHPQVFISREQIARLLGHQLDDTNRSLEGLLAAGVLKRTEGQASPAQMFVLSAAAHEGPIAAVVALASSREGRAALRRVLDHDHEPPDALEHEER